MANIVPYISGDLFPDPATSTTSATSAATSLAMKIVSDLLLIAAVIAVFYLIWAGIMYIQAGSDMKKAATARGTIVNVVIGIVLIVCTYSLITLGQQIGNFFNNPAASSISSSGNSGSSPSNVDCGPGTVAVADSSGQVHCESTDSPTPSPSDSSCPDGFYPSYPPGGGVPECQPDTNGDSSGSGDFGNFTN